MNTLGLLVGFTSHTYSCAPSLWWPKEDQEGTELEQERRIRVRFREDRQAGDWIGTGKGGHGIRPFKLGKQEIDVEHERRTRDWAQ
jgi:hypothetical protein